METGHGEIELKYQTENGNPCDFLNLFTICSSCKRKFVVCPFVDEETNESYPFANGLNGIAHLCLHLRIVMSRGQ
jgi:hypothetical protein